MDINSEYEVRLEKLHALQKKGYNAYLDSFKCTHTSATINDYVKSKGITTARELSQPDSSVRVRGRVINKRDFGGITFIDIRDSNGDVQVCLKEEYISKDDWDLAKEYIDLGDFIGVEGDVFFTKQEKLCVFASRIYILSKTLRPFPKEHFGIADGEIKYRQRYLDTSLDKKAHERFITRSLFVEGLRQWLLQHNFIEFVTRTLQRQAGGAIAQTFDVKHNYLKETFSLRISNELDLKMIIAGGYERVFEFAIDFRNEGIDASHLQEFQMLEWYAAYHNYEDGMKWAQELIQHALQYATGKTYFSYKDRKIDMSNDIPTITFKSLLAKNKIDMDASKDQLFKTMKEYDKAYDSSARSRANILDDIYKKIIRPTIIKPLFITHYPVDLVPLARVSDKDNTIADSYQLVIAGWEVVKGYSELVNPIQQRKALEQQQKAKKEGDKEAMEINEEFLTAMEHGMPPITGCGIGIDRICALITNQSNLKDVVYLPLLAKNNDI